MDVGRVVAVEAESSDAGNATRADSRPRQMSAIAPPAAGPGIRLESAGIRPDRFRQALSLFPSGLVIIAARDEAQKDVGFTCQSFYSVSLDPPLISFSVMKTSSTYPAIRKVGRFSVSVLSQQHDAISRQLGRRGDDKWSGISLSRTRIGNPVLADSLIWLDCDVVDEHDAGDHLIVVGQVTEIAPRTDVDAEPLLFFAGGFRKLDRATPAGDLP